MFHLVVWMLEFHHPTFYLVSRLQSIYFFQKVIQRTFYSISRKLNIIYPMYNKIDNYIEMMLKWSPHLQTQLLTKRSTSYFLSYLLLYFIFIFFHLPWCTLYRFFLLNLHRFPCHFYLVCHRKMKSRLTDLYPYRTLWNHRKIIEKRKVARLTYALIER